MDQSFELRGKIAQIQDLADNLVEAFQNSDRAGCIELLKAIENSAQFLGAQLGAMPPLPS